MVGRIIDRRCGEFDGNVVNPVEVEGVYPVSPFQQPLPGGGGIGSQRCGGPETSDDDVAHEFSSIGGWVMWAAVRGRRAPDAVEVSPGAR